VNISEISTQGKKQRIKISTQVDIVGYNQPWQGETRRKEHH